MDNRKHISRYWIEWVVADGNHRPELVIETDLETRIDMPGFDADKLNDLVAAAIEEMNQSGYERVRVVPVGARPSIS